MPRPNATHGAQAALHCINAGRNLALMFCKSAGRRDQSTMPLSVSHLLIRSAT
jgi:hypothetical protein